MNDGGEVSIISANGGLSGTGSITAARISVDQGGDSAFDGTLNIDGTYAVYNDIFIKFQVR